MVVSSPLYVCDGGGGGGGGGGVCVCVCVCVCERERERECVCLCLCAWSGWFLLQSPEMKLAFLLQFISR